MAKVVTVSDLTEAAMSKPPMHVVYLQDQLKAIPAREPNPALQHQLACDVLLNYISDDGVTAAFNAIPRGA